MFTDLPVLVADPLERLATVRVQMQDLKGEPPGGAHGIRRC